MGWAEREGSRTEPTDPVHFRRLLRRSDHWRGEDAKGEQHEEADRCAPHKHLLGVKMHSVGR